MWMLSVSSSLQAGHRSGRWSRRQSTRGWRPTRFLPTVRVSSQARVTARPTGTPSTSPRLSSLRQRLRAGLDPQGQCGREFIKAAVSGQPLEVYGDGCQTRDFTYVDDLAQAVKLAATVKAASRETFQIATNPETSVGELGEMLLPILAEARICAPSIRHAAPRLGDVRRNYSDTPKARTVLGWKPEVPLEDGLRRTVTFFAGAGSRVGLSKGGSFRVGRKRPRKI